MSQYLTDAHKQRQTKHAEWLAQLKANDEVILTHGGWSSRHTLHVVDRTTATQVLLVGCPNTRFSRKDGRAIGGNRYSTSRIEEPTQELRQKAERQELEDWMARIKPSELTLEQLRAMRQAQADNMPPPTTH